MVPQKIKTCLKKHWTVSLHQKVLNPGQEDDRTVEGRMGRSTYRGVKTPGYEK